MKRKSYTILLLTPGSGRFRKVEFSPFLIWGLGAALAVGLLALLAVPGMMVEARDRGDADRLADENRALRRKQLAFEEKLNQISGQLNSFEAQTSRLATELGVEDLPSTRPRCRRKRGRPRLRAGAGALGAGVPHRRSRSVPRRPGPAFPRTHPAAGIHAQRHARGRLVLPRVRLAQRPWTGKREFHKGMDIVADAGAEIVAPADGVVSYAGRNGGYGKTVDLSHGYGYVTRYAHMSEILVRPGSGSAAASCWAVSAPRDARRALTCTTRSSGTTVGSTPGSTWARRGARPGNRRSRPPRQGLSRPHATLSFMTGREPAEVDPDVLADPLGEDDSDEIDVQAEEVEPAAPAASTALAPAGKRGLAPFDPFRRYMAELKKYPPLTREEETELARLYRDTGDKEALFRLITSNLILVVRVALSFRRAARNLLDLIQEGNLGLLQAIDRFDPEVGVRLPTYAAWWVRAYMVKFLLDNVRLVRVGTTNARRKLLRNLRKEKQRLEEMGYEVGPRLLAEHFGVSEEDVRDVQAASNPGRADRCPDVTRQRSPGELLPAEEPTAEEAVTRRQLQERTEAAIAGLPRGVVGTGGRDPRRAPGQRVAPDAPGPRGAFRHQPRGGPSGGGTAQEAAGRASEGGARRPGADRYRRLLTRRRACLTQKVCWVPWADLHIGLARTNIENR